MIATACRRRGPSSSPVMSSDSVPLCCGDGGSGGDEGGDGAFHVVGAAAGEQAVLDVRLERIAGPAFARRDDVEVAGEAEVRGARSADGDEVFDRRVRRG